MTEAPPPATTAAFRAIEARTRRTLEDLNEDDVEGLVAFLQTPAPGAGLAVLAAFACAVIVVAVVDHPFINWVSVMSLMMPGAGLSMYLPHRRRLQRFLRDDLRLDEANARALFIFTVWLSRSQLGAFAPPLAYTRGLIAKARARRDGTG